MTKYEPKTTPMERKLMLQMQQELFPGPDVDVVRNVLIDLHTCEACLAEALAEVERLKRYVINQPCTCRYQGDGDTITCNRCQALGELK